MELIDSVIEETPRAKWREDVRHWEIIVPSGETFYGIRSKYKPDGPVVFISSYLSNIYETSNMDPEDHVVILLYAGKTKEEDEEIINVWNEINYLSVRGRGIFHPKKDIIKVYDNYLEKTNVSW